MGKIKGWSKTLELPFRIEYNNTTKRFNRNLGLGHCAILISREPEHNSSVPERNEWSNAWGVTYRWYAGPEQGQQYEKLKVDMTKQEALQYAYVYMRRNPNG